MVILLSNEISIYTKTLWIDGWLWFYDILSKHAASGYIMPQSFTQK